MTRQKSENRIVPKDPRKLVPTRGYLGGGKAIPVSKQAQQLGLFPVTVENPASAEVDDTLETDVSESGVLALPKAVKHKEHDVSAMAGWWEHLSLVAPVRQRKLCWG